MDLKYLQGYSLDILHSADLWNDSLNFRPNTKGIKTVHHVLGDCETLNKRRQALYRQLKLSSKEYDQYSRKALSIKTNMMKYLS